jgi:hypothetical protein
VFRSIKGQKPELLLGDLKRFTSKISVKSIQENPRESRKEFLLDFFKKEAEKSSNVKNYQFWRHDNKPIELWSNKVIQQKIEYVHNNPVAGGLVYKDTKPHERIRALAWGLTMLAQMATIGQVP